MNIEIQNFISIFVFRLIEMFDSFISSSRESSLRISCSQWRFSLSPIYKRKTSQNLNIKLKSFILIIVFRYSPTWRFCTIASMLIANMMFAVKDAHLHPSTKEKLIKIGISKYRILFSFTIIVQLTFLCSMSTVVLVANIVFTAKMLIFTQLRKKNFAKFE